MNYNQAPLNDFRPHSTMSAHTPHPSQSMPNSGPGTPLVNMFGLEMNNPFHPAMMGQLVGAGQQNPRVNDWFSWQAIPGNGRSGVPSMLSQLSMGAATHLSMFSQQSRFTHPVKQEKFDRADMDYIINCLSNNFDIAETDVNSSVINIITGLRSLDKEQAREVLDALWKALSNVDYRKLADTRDPRVLETLYAFVTQFFNLSKSFSYPDPEVLVSSSDEEKGRVLKCLLLLLRHKPHEPPFQLINVLVTRSSLCQHILSSRGENPLLDSMLTLQIACRELNAYEVKQRPRPLLALLRIILVIIGSKEEDVPPEARKALMDYFINESLLMTIRLFTESIQLFAKSASQTTPQTRLNSEAYGCMIRTISRLLHFLSETEHASTLVDGNIIEQLLLVRLLPFTDKTGIEARANAIKTYANLSCGRNCSERIRLLNLHEPVKFTFECLVELTKYATNSQAIRNPEDVFARGTGFLANATSLNLRVREQIARDPSLMNFIICTCFDWFRMLTDEQKRPPQHIVLNLVRTIDHCITILCQLNNFKDTNPQMSQLRVETSQILFNLPQILAFTCAVLFPVAYLARLGDALNDLTKSVLKMWRRGFLDGIFPAPSGDPAHEDIGVFLLNFFTNNITYVDTMDRRRQEAMEIAFELIKLLIEAQNVYTQIIERRLCAKNAEFAPFQLLNKLKPMGASLMLNFLNACCKLEKLKQIWAEERDNQGQLVNQQIVSRFIHSTDGNISSASMLINQQLFLDEYGSFGGVMYSGGGFSGGNF